jgi:uncharacterized protein (TIGR01244 family)
MKSMTRILILLASIALGACAASAGDTDLAAVSTLKADLAAVAELGTVVPVDGVTTAGQPNAEQFGVFAEKGYVAVIDLRTEGEDRGLDEPAVVADLGMQYVPFPIGRGDLTYEKAKALDELIAGYDEPVLVHCGSANRVGALVALREYSESGDLDKALAAGREAGMTRLEETVRKVIGGE